MPSLVFAGQLLFIEALSLCIQTFAYGRPDRVLLPLRHLVYRAELWARVEISEALVYS